MKTYEFDIILTVDGENEEEALEEALVLLRSRRFVKEGATITLLNDEGDR